MYAEIVTRTYRQYQTITREQAFSRGFDGKWLLNEYDAVVARDLLGQYAKAVAVDFCRPLHNENKARYTPPSDYIVYVKSQAGRAKRIRFGVNVQ